MIFISEILKIVHEEYHLLTFFTKMLNRYLRYLALLLAKTIGATRLASKQKHTDISM